MRVNARGFSLLELVVVIVIIALLAVIAIARLLAIQADAEKVAMETVAGTLRSALGIRVAASVARHELPQLAELEGTNPMRQLVEMPRNYLGELDKPDPAKLENGNWYFDTSEHVLVYLVRNGTHFEGGLSEPARVRFAVQLAYEDRNRNGRFDAGVDSIEGLRLAPIEPYRWVH